MDWDEIQKDLDVLNKKFGKGTVNLVGLQPIEKVEVISTGSYGLDYKLGIGGLPRGKVIEIYGPPSSSKTTLSGHVCANAQKEGGIAAYIDAEHEVDLHYFKNIGVDVEHLIFSQPDTLEQGLSLLENLIELNKIDVIVFDSIAQASTKAEIEGTIETQQMGDKARIIGKHLRKITPILSKTKTLVIFVNQTRSQIGLYGGGIVTPGGEAIKFKSAIRIELRKVSAIVKNNEQVGIRVRAKMVKNKLASPMTSWEFQVEFGKGIIGELDIIELGVETGIIQKSGSWFSYNDTNIGQGMFNAADYLRENSSVKKEIVTKIFTLLDKNQTTETEDSL